jgi:hypothetical protein
MVLRSLWLKLMVVLGLGPPVTAPAVPLQPREVLPDTAPSGLRPVASAGWSLGWESPLPGMRGHLVLPAGTGLQTMVPFGTVSVMELIRTLQRLAQLVESGQVDAAGAEQVGQLSLEGPDWYMYAWLIDGLERMAYQAGRPATGEYLAGDAPVWVLLEALVLSPDYDRVAQYLRLNSHRGPDYGALV